MVEQSYKIRRNSDGSMLYCDAKELADLCLKEGILQGEPGEYIFVYRTGGSEYPEGWWKEPYEEVIQEIMRDESAPPCFLQALSEKDIEFVPSLSDAVLNFFDSDFLADIRDNFGESLGEEEAL